MSADNKQPFYRVISTFDDIKNKSLTVDYLAVKNTPEAQKTHFFDGRYENIYIDRESIPLIPELLQEAIEHASQVLGNNQRLKVGFWFNEMQPGHKTTTHTHDENDELLSGVYYINVPDNSGRLILGDVSNGLNECVSITPNAGEIIFFSPHLLHSVNENKSNQMRLSIGMNFGPA